MIPQVERRLGCGDQSSSKGPGSAIRHHAWFGSVDWVKLAAEQVDAPLKDFVQTKLSQIVEGTARASEEPCLPHYARAQSEDLWFDKF